MRLPTMKVRILRSIWVALLAVAVLSMAGDTFGAGDGVTQLAKSHLYSIPRWEIGNFLSKWTAGLGRALSGGGPSEEEKAANVRRYFEIGIEVVRLADRVDRADFGLTEEPELEDLRARLHALREEREALEPEIEETLEAAISETLKVEGVSSTFVGFELLWPPVDFHFDDLPKLLVLSRRDHIATIRSTLLEPGITTEEREVLEDAIARRDLSALVVSIGGVATYPALIREGTQVRWALRIASHEWTHHYLAFHPLGRAYYDNGDMTTLNESVADVVGDEIGDLVWRRFFASPEEIAAADAQEAAEAEAKRAAEAREKEEEKSAAEAEPPRFDFNTFMRETREQADSLLAEGRIDEAEAYMEARRVELATHGYFFRKINQAYFAFHGSYAVRPGSGSVSPIGGQVTALRESVASIGDFLRAVNRYGDYESFLAGTGL